MFSAVIPSIVMLAGLFLGFSAYVLAAVLVHEAGHILGGLLCGFRIIALKVGPVQLQLPHPWQWTLSRKRFLDGSVQAQFRKVPGLWSKWQSFGFLLGGSLANFCAALLIIPFAIRDTVSANVFALFILASAFVGVAQLIPFKVIGRLSDGAKLYSLLFNNTKREELIFLLSLRARVDEVRMLFRDRRYQEVFNKIEELISGTERIPSFRVDAHAMEKLFKLRDTLQQHLSGTVDASIQTASELN